MAMIGYLDEVRKQCDGHAGIARGLEYLAGLTPEAIEGQAEGESRRVEIDGDQLFAMPQTYMTQSARVAKFEGHQRYIDLQLVASGHERMLVAARRDCVTTTPYDSEKDVEFFEGPRPATALAVWPGMVAVFFPEDIHAPCLMLEYPERVCKCVVKVAV